MAATLEQVTREDSGITIISKDAWVPDRVGHALKTFSPKSELGKLVKEVCPFLPPDAAIELLDRVTRCVVIESGVYCTIIHSANCCSKRGTREYFGLASKKKVTTVGVAYLVDAWQNLLELEDMKYHGIGTGTTAEANSQTALTTELTTEYNPNSTRATGSLTEGASANIFRSIGTNTLDGTPGAAVNEHGLFSNATVGSGVLWDRSLVGPYTMVSGEGLQTTYDMTASAEA